MPEGQTRNLMVAGAGAVASAAAALGLARLFSDAGWILPTALATAGASALVLLTRGWPAIRAVGVLAAGLAVLVAGAVAGHTTFYGLPTWATAEALGRAVTGGFDAFSSAKPPLATTPGPLLMSLTGVWLAAAATAWLTLRSSVPLAAVTPPVVLHVALAIIDPYGLDVATTVAVTTAGLFFVSVHHASSLPATWFEGRRPPPKRGRLLLAGAAVAVVVGAAGVVVGPVLPGADASALIELREASEEGEGPREVISPLVDIKARLTTTPPQDLFTVASDAPLYWRLTALPDYQDKGWGSYLDYDPPGKVLERSPAGLARPPLRQRFEVATLPFFWLPAAYRPVAIEAKGVQVNPETLTLYTKADSASGLAYDVESEVPLWSPDELASATVSTDPDMAGYLELPATFPQSIRDLAAKVTAGAKGPYQAARTLLDHLRREYRYDLATPPGHKPSDLAAFLFERKAGYCEQFAASFATMARSLGIPARVAVGWTPGVYNQSLGKFLVTSAESHAWVELHFEGFGWVTFEPTPGREAPDPSRGGAAPDPNSLVGAPPDLPNQETNDDPTGDGPGNGAAGATAAAQPPPPQDDGGGGDGPGSPLSRWWTLLRIVGLLLLLAALAVASVPPLVKRWRRNRRRGAAGARARIAGAWAEATDRLREVGAVAPASATPREFAGAFAQAAPHYQRDIVVGLTQLAGIVTRAAYAPGEPTEDDSTRAWLAVDIIMAALDSADSFVGKTLRRLDPATLREPAFST